MGNPVFTKPPALQQRAAHQERWSPLSLPPRLPLSCVVPRDCPTLQMLSRQAGLCLAAWDSLSSKDWPLSQRLAGERVLSLFAACLTIYFCGSREAQPSCPDCFGDGALQLLLGLVPPRACSPLPPQPGGGPKAALTLTRAGAGSTLPRESAPKRETEGARCL